MMRRPTLRWAWALVSALVLACDQPEESGEPAEEVYPPALFRFGLVADIQYADKPTVGERRYREALAKLERGVEDWENDRLAFIVQLGDLIDGRETREDSMKDLLAVLKVFSQSIVPLVHVIGNHCLEIPREALQPALQIFAPYHSFVKNDWRFIVLDTLDVSTCGWPEDSNAYKVAAQWLEEHPTSEHPQAQSWNGGLSDAQMQWLREELVKAQAREERVVIFCHHPLLAEASSPRHLAWNHAEIVKLLDSASGVVAVFSGHDHDGGYAQRGETHYVTLKGMVEARTGSNAYAVVDVYDDRLELRGRGEVESRVLELPVSGDSATNGETLPE